MTAPPASGFWQVDPDEGAPASEPTEVRFLYDDDAIYVGAWLWDNDGQIPQRLARRDVGTGDVDLFAVHFDSYHSHRSSNRLSVIASGTMRDVAAGANEGRLTGGDLSWDPVWEVRTTVTDHGWFVEMRIPFSQLRFNPEEEQVWGLQMERKIRPQQENTVWVWIPKTEPQGQITFGHLVGLSGIKPGKRLELLPYAGGSAEYVAVPRNEDVAFDNPFRSGSDYFGNVGLDLKYRLTSNLTLDGTINPDFGQVEVDPAVINLTAFETRYEERRPFFVEGAEIFDFGGGSSGGRGGPSRQTPQVLYSRRIGRAPQGSVPSEAAYDLMPGVTTILGAAKLSGKTASGWSLAALDAVTSREMALWQDEENVEDESEVEPLTNYFARAGPPRAACRADESGSAVHGGAPRSLGLTTRGGSPRHGLQRRRRLQPRLRGPSLAGERLVFSQLRHRQQRCSDRDPAQVEPVLPAPGRRLSRDRFGRHVALWLLRSGGDLEAVRYVALRDVCLGHEPGLRGERPRLLHARRPHRSEHRARVSADHAGTRLP